MRTYLTFIGLLCLSYFLVGCGDPSPKNAPTKNTPTGAKVDLTGINLTVSETEIRKTQEGKYLLHLNYTIDNTSGSNVSFPCLYASMDHLIEINLTDKKDQPITLGKRPLEGLTMTQPRPMVIPVGKTTRSYTAPIVTTGLKKGDLIHARVRLHTPSRYDELRTSLEAPRFSIPWPE